MRRTLLALSACALLQVPGSAHAEADVRLRGLLDLGLVSSLDGRELNRLTFGDSNFDPYRLRLFLDARLSPTLEVHVQSILHEGAGALRADGAYALWTPWTGRDLSLEAGKIPWPIGTYAPRTYSDRNWLMGTPLLYQYRTALPWNDVLFNTDELVQNAGIAQLVPEVPWLPIIDERWWDTGAALLGSLPPLEWSAGVVQGSPSWPSPGPDNTPGQTVLGRVGVAPAPGIRVGISGAEGTWMPAFFEWALPSGRRVRDYRETTLMADLELAHGPFEVRGEAFRRRWETMFTGDLGARGGYAEARWSMSTGAWLALRGEALRFSDVATSTVAERPWDDPVDRWEGVLGYRLTREVRAKCGMQRTVRHPHAAGRVRTDLLFAGLGIQF